MAGITVRKAGLQDKEAVMQIRENIYGGRDYLPSYYDSFVNSENCFPYVAVLGEEIVGYCAAFMVDDMKTLITRGARVSPKHGGKGVYKVLMEYIKDRARDMGAIHYSFTTGSDNKAVLTESFRRNNRQILAKECLSYLLDKQEWRTNQERPAPSGTCIPEAKEQDLEMYISSEKYTKYLFPDDVLIINWVPYRLSMSNLNVIKKMETSLILSDVTVGEGPPKGMMSITTLYQSPSDVFCCHLDLYGSDNSSFKQHLTQQIEFITSTVHGQISLVIFVDSTMDVDDIKQAASNSVLHEKPWVDIHDSSVHFTKLLLFESDL